MLFKDRLEVWNPGRLPQGMTIKKLKGEHSSFPVNPVLANPVYLAGYIEQMGTGTTDIIDSCEAMNLKTPEFHQIEDFRTILWRAEDIDNENNTNQNIRECRKHLRNNAVVNNSFCTVNCWYVKKASKASKEVTSACNYNCEYC